MKVNAYAWIKCAVMATAILALAGCGGSDGSQGAQGPKGDDGQKAAQGSFSAISIDAAPKLNQLKKIQLSWTFDGDTPDHYIIEVNANGNSGFSQADINGDGVVDDQDRLAGSETSVTTPLPLYLVDFNRTLYRVVAVDDLGREMDASTSVSNALTKATVDGLISYIKASDTSADSHFGISVALTTDGNTLVVGAYGAAGTAGAVYVFERDPTTGIWSQQGLPIKASIPNSGDYFGVSVALAGDGSTLVVGALGEDSDGTGVGAVENNTGASDSGAVYVFTHTGNGWTQQEYIKSSNADAGDEFGEKVALSNDGNTLVVAATRESSAGKGVDSHLHYDNSASYAGAVYVFTRTGGSWSEEEYIKASNTKKNHFFGYSIALSGDGETLAVGANREGSGSAGVGAGQDDDGLFGTGAVYIFKRAEFGGDSWFQEEYIKASNPSKGARFGTSVTLSKNGKTLAVGATHASDTGAAYIFAYNTATSAWSQRAYLKASNVERAESFGTNLALTDDGNTLAVGVPHEDGSATGIIDGNLGQYFFGDSGAVYIFTRVDNAWSQRSYIKASNTDAYDNFGNSIALAGDGSALAVGASLEESNAKGIDGDGSDNSLNDAGAAYIY